MAIDKTFSDLSANPAVRLITGKFRAHEFTDVLLLKGPALNGLRVASPNHGSFDVVTTTEQLAIRFMEDSAAAASIKVGDMNGDGFDDVILLGVAFTTVGCFYEKDNDKERAMAVKLPGSDASSPVQCATECKAAGYTFSALQVCNQYDCHSRVP